MLRPRVMTLPANIQCVYLQNIMKVFAIALTQAEEEEDNERALNLTRVLLEKLSIFLQSSYIEVQERVRHYLYAHTVEHVNLYRENCTCL